MTEPKSPGRLYAELGEVLFQTGRYEDAADALRKAVAENLPAAERAQASLLLGRAAKALNKPADALEAVVNALRFNPNSFSDVIAEIASLRPALAGTETAAQQSALNQLKTLLSEAESQVLPASRNAASDLMKQGKFADAEAALRQLAWLWPNDPPTQEALAEALLKQNKYSALGELYNQLGKYREAVDALGRLLQSKPDDAEALRSRGIALRKLGQFEASERDLRRAAELEPGDDAALRELAATQEAAGRAAEAAVTLTQAATVLLAKQSYAAAEQLCRRAVGLDASNGRASLALGQALIGQARYADALAALGRAVELNTGPDAYAEIARAHSFRNDFGKALEAVKRALALAPDSPEYLAIEGIVLNGLGRYEEALDTLNRSLALKPNQPRILAAKAPVLAALGRKAEAISVLEQAVDSDPHNFEALRYLGLLLFEDGKYERAAAALERAVKLSPEASLYEMMGIALYRSNKLQEAIASCDQALRLDPGTADASRYRGFALRQLGDNEKAVAALQLAIDLDSSQNKEADPQTYAELGEALRLLNRHREAETAFKKSLARRPGDGWTLARYGETLRMLTKYDEAVRALQAVDIQQRDSWVWASLGAALMNLEQYRSALASLEKALEVQSNDDWAWGHRGIVLRMCSRFERALEAYQKSLGLNNKAAWVWVEKGMALRQQNVNQLGLALPALEQAVALDAAYGWAYFQLSLVLYGLARYEEAMQSVEKAIKFDSSIALANTLKALIAEQRAPTPPPNPPVEASKELSNVNLYLDRADLYSNVGQYEAAAQALKIALQLREDAARDLESKGDASALAKARKDLGEICNSLAWLYAASMEQHFEEAEALAKRAVELTEGSEPIFRAKIFDTLGWVYYKRGATQEALSILEKAFDMNRESLELEDHLQACRARLAAGASP